MLGEWQGPGAGRLRTFQGAKETWGASRLSRALSLASAGGGSGMEPCGYTLFWAAVSLSPCLAGILWQIKATLTQRASASASLLRASPTSDGQSWELNFSKLASRPEPVGSWSKRWHAAKGLTEESFMEGLFIQMWAGLWEHRGRGKSWRSPFLWHVQCGHLQRQRADQCLPKARGPGAGGWGGDCWRVPGFFWADATVLKLMVVTAARLCECSPNHWMVYFKRVNRVARELYLNKAHVYIYIWSEASRHLRTKQQGNSCPQTGGEGPVMLDPESGRKLGSRGRRDPTPSFPPQPPTCVP